MRQIAITIMMLLFSVSICDAQGLGKAAASAARGVRVNKAMVAAQAVRGYSIQERQRQQNLQKLIKRSIPPIVNIDPAVFTSIKPIPAATQKVQLPSPQLRVMNTPDMKKLLSVPSLDSLSKVIPSDTTIINMNK